MGLIWYITCHSVTQISWLGSRELVSDTWNNFSINRIIKSFLPFFFFFWQSNVSFLETFWSSRVSTFCHLRHGECCLAYGLQSLQSPPHQAEGTMDEQVAAAHTLVWHSQGPVPSAPSPQPPQSDVEGFASTGCINLCSTWESLMEAIDKKQKGNCKARINFSKHWKLFLVKEIVL